MKLRVGVVGLGDAWESRHQPALRALSDRYEVRAVCAEVSTLAVQAAADFDATPVDGFRALASRDDIDAVFMLSPGWYGALPLLSACEFGKSIYCAAPLDITPEQTSAVRNRVEEAGVAFMAEFPRRLSPATIRLKELIATRLGSPQLLFCHWRMDQPKPSLLTGCETPLPVLMRELTELVDWCCYVVGSKPTSVVGLEHLASDCPMENDYQMLSLDFSAPGAAGTGPMAQVSCGDYLAMRSPDAASFRRPSELQICCEKGIAFVDLPAGITWFDEAGRHRESLESERPVGEQLLTQFFRSVTSLVRKTDDLEDAYHTLTILQRSKASFLEGRRELL